MTTASPGFRLRILGGVDLRDPSGREVRAVLTQPKRLVLLAYLALGCPNRFVRRDSLIALFWPDSDQDAARHSLRSALHFLRQSLGEGVINGRGQEEVGLRDAGLWCDAIAFERALAEGKPADALKLYRGDLLEGFFVPDASPEFEQWLDQERNRLRGRAAEAAATLAEAAEREGNGALARHWAASCVGLAPYDEGAVRRLMAMELRMGDRAGALQLYEDSAARLAKDLEIEPSAETRRFAEAIRQPEIASAPAAPRNDGGAPPATHDDRRAPAAARDHKRRNLVLGVVAVVFVGILAAVIALRPSKPDSPPVLAVGTIESRLAERSDSTDLTGTLRELLATDLARVDGLQVISEARLIELLGQLGVRRETPASRTEAARRAGAGELLEGVLYRRNPNLLRLDLRRVDLATGVLRGGISTEAVDVFALADSATVALGRSFGLEAPADPLARVTTTSLVARRFYEEGLREYHQGDGTLALRLLRSALAEDSTFAMAAYYAALAAAWVEPSDAPTLIVQARRAAATLPDRERLIIEAGWSQMANDPSAVAVAESLATRYPTEPEGEYAWGLALIWSGELRAGIVHLERTVMMDSAGLAGRTPWCRACEALDATVDALAGLGDAQAAGATARRWVENQPESPRPWGVLARYLEREGRSAEALEAHRRQVELVPSLAPGYAWLRTRLAIRAGRFAEADRFLTSASAAPGSAEEVEVLWWQVISQRNQGRLEAALEVARRYRRIRESQGSPGAALPEAQVLFEMGRFREAAVLFEKLAIAALRPVPAEAVLGSVGNQARRGSWSLTHAAVAWGAAGDTARLAALADSVERLGRGSAFGRDRRLHFFLRGLLARARGRPDEAEAMFRQAKTPWVGDYSRINLELGQLLIERHRPLEAVPVLRAALRWDLEASNYYVTHRELHRELARAFRAAGLGDSATVHERWGTTKP